jgi:hypothetical protein
VQHLFSAIVIVAIVTTLFVSVLLPPLIRFGGANG